MYSKMFCLGKIYNEYGNINILEYKKDGAIFSGNMLDVSNSTNFTNYLRNNNVLFHIEKIKNYMRFNKTSIYQYLNGNIEIKGQLKNPPLYISKTLLPSIFSGEGSTLLDLNNIYSRSYMEILKKSGNFEKYKQYYVFDNSKVINQNGTLEKSILAANPKWILRYFVYPVLSLIRSSK
jgi:hypothetical protein